MLHLKKLIHSKHSINILFFYNYRGKIIINYQLSNLWSLIPLKEQVLKCTLHWGDIWHWSISLADLVIEEDICSIYIFYPFLLVSLQHASSNVCGVVLDIHKKATGEMYKSSQHVPHELSEERVNELTGSWGAWGAVKWGV